MIDLGRLCGKVDKWEMGWVVGYEESLEGCYIIKQDWVALMSKPIALF